MASVNLISGELKYHKEIRIRYPHACLPRSLVEVAEGEIWLSKKIRFSFHWLLPRLEVVTLVSSYVASTIPIDLWLDGLGLVILFSPFW